MTHLLDAIRWLGSQVQGAWDHQVSLIAAVDALRSPEKLVLEEDVKSDRPPWIPAEAIMPPAGIDLTGMVVVVYGSPRQKGPHIKGQPDFWFSAEVTEAIVHPDGRFFNYRTGCYIGGTPTLRS